jgi:hypothetical protein
VIIAKRRNGPTGTVELVFQKELTRFENLDRRHVRSNEGDRIGGVLRPASPRLFLAIDAVLDGTATDAAYGLGWDSHAGRGILHFANIRSQTHAGYHRTRRAKKSIWRNDSNRKRGTLTMSFSPLGL